MLTILSILLGIIFTAMAVYLFIGFAALVVGAKVVYVIVMIALIVGLISLIRRLLT